MRPIWERGLFERAASVRDFTVFLLKNWLLAWILNKWLWHQRLIFCILNWLICLRLEYFSLLLWLLIMFEIWVVMLKIWPFLLEIWLLLQKKFVFFSTRRENGQMNNIYSALDINLNLLGLEDHSSSDRAKSAASFPCNFSRGCSKIARSDSPWVGFRRPTWKQI